MKNWISFPRVEGTVTRQAHADLPEGTYEREMITLDVRRGDTGLQVDVLLRTPPAGWEPALQLPPARIGFHSQDRVIALEGPNEGGRASFIRDSDGNIEWLRWGGRVHRRLPN